MAESSSSNFAKLQKEPTLLPTPTLSPDAFEDFVERLLHAHRFASDVTPRVARVERWGRKGDKQDGIDFEGNWSDSRSAVWQCKRLDNLGAANVHKFVEDCTYVADTYYLTYSGEASSAARTAIAIHPGWEILDQRGLGRMLNELPLHRRREVLDATWGIPIRKLLIRMPGEDSFMDVADLIATRNDESSYLNDLGPYVGRQDEVDALCALLDPDGDWAPVIIVSGNGGAGKSRLMSHVLQQLEVAHPELPVLWLTPGRSVDADALMELPHRPSIIVVDDAHRDPTQLSALLTYQKAVPGTRIVLGSRKVGRDPLRALMIRDGLGPHQIGEVELPDLTKKGAKHLVESLARGLDLPFDLVDHLAATASDAPFVAVLAVNMIRRGELTGPVAMDRNLREVVLARYEELLVGSVAGFTSATVRRLLGTVSALGSVDIDDEAIRRNLADFVGLDLLSFPRLLAALETQGVLVVRSGSARVVPDVLADQVLEREAVEGKLDTTFVRQMWAKFGGVSHTALITNLAALGWRLSQYGLPQPLDSVWDGIKQQIAISSRDELEGFVGGLDTLPYTQPTELMGLLGAVRNRLDELDTKQTGELLVAKSSVEPGTLDGFPPPGEPGSSLLQRATVRRLMGLEPSSRADVERRLPRLYGRSAVQEPALLEHALDNLWDLRTRDFRAPHSYPEHAERIIADDLANLGKMPHPDFPSRIADWTGSLLNNLTEGWANASPFVAVRPLVSKEGLRTRLSDRRTLAMEPYFVNAELARAIRDRIRTLCVGAVEQHDARLTGHALRVLGEALHEPHGYFGQTVPIEVISSWEADDLATIEAFATASRVTESAAARREVRRAVTWSAEYSHSRQVRHAALRLINELDQLPGDDLVDWLDAGFDLHLPSQRGGTVPALSDLPTHEAGTVSDEQLRTLIAESDAASAKQLDDVLEALSTRPAVDRLRSIAEAVEDIHAVLEVPRSRVDDLVRQISIRNPDQCAELVEALVAMPPSPLDDEIMYLLGGWRTVDEQGLLDWLSAREPVRREIRLAIARAFSRLDWSTSAAFEPALRAGWEDTDPQVAQSFLVASHARLALDPTSAIAELRTNGATDESLASAVNHAAGWKRRDWGASLDDDAASAVLDVLAAVGWGTRDESSIISGIASRYPTKVLDRFLADARAGIQLPHGLSGFAEAVGATTDLATWILRNVRGCDRHLFDVTGIALENGPSDENAAVLADAVASMPAPELSALVGVLGDAPLWPVAHPELGKRVLARAKELGDPTLDDVVERVADAMTPNGYGWTNGQSPELDHASQLVGQRISEETDPDFRSLLLIAAERLRNDIDRLRREGDDDDY